MNVLGRKRVSTFEPGTQEAVDSSVHRTSANHVTAETDRKQLEKAAPVADRRRCE
jgi:hypothetical protein